MPKKVFERPIILGVVGDSATGKSTLSNGIAKILGEDRCTVICTDDYHAFDRVERSQNGLSALDPRCNYVDILEQHLKALKQGEPILKPIYNHHHGTLDRPEYIKPKSYVIAEGLLGYSTRAMRECYDVKLYLDPEEELRVRWKIHRDTTKRGYTREEVLKSLEKRKSDSPAFIQPQRTFADIVVRFQRPQINGSDDTHLDVRHILRPTLPHPDFSPLINGQTRDGIHFELARDSDGKPVDVLEISGGTTAEQAEKLEALLWRLIPEASHLRDQVGQIDSNEDGRRVSHPLALTQLIIAYHMVKAALGEYAV
jgi:phosphoribulokinase